MKKPVLIIFALALLSFVLINDAVAEEMGGGNMMVVGAIVDKETVVKVKGKAAALSDIKNGDMVTIRLLRSDNLYAKKITKK